MVCSGPSKKDYYEQIEGGCTGRPCSSATSTRGRPAAAPGVHRAGAAHRHRKAAVGELGPLMESAPQEPRVFVTYSWARRWASYTQSSRGGDRGSLWEQSAGREQVGESGWPFSARPVGVNQKASPALGASPPEVGPLPSPHRSEPAVLGMAVPLSTVSVDSGPHSLGASSAPHREEDPGPGKPHFRPRKLACFWHDNLFSYFSGPRLIKGRECCQSKEVAKNIKAAK